MEEKRALSLKLVLHHGSAGIEIAIISPTQSLKITYIIMYVHVYVFHLLYIHVRSTDPEPAQLGINRLWVSSTYRRKGVASKLLDAAR